MINCNAPECVKFQTSYVLLSIAVFAEGRPSGSMACDPREVK